VKENGDNRRHWQYTLEYDKADIVGLRVTEGELPLGVRKCLQDIIDALYHLSDNITSFHMRQVTSDLLASRGLLPELFSAKGPRHSTEFGAYVPGGFALYPSTALMNIVPAKVAGVREVVVCIPPMPDGTVPWQRFSLPTLQVRTLSIRLGGRRRSLQWHMGHRASRRWTRSLDRATCT